MRRLNVVQDLTSLIEVPQGELFGVEKASNPGGGAVLAEISRWSNE